MYPSPLRQLTLRLLLVNSSMLTPPVIVCFRSASVPVSLVPIFRLDLITHSCVLLTFWSVMLITDLCSVYVTHPFVIRRLLATSPLCLSSASQLLYISDVKYKYSARWGDCPSVWISSWILHVNSPLFSSISSAFWQLWPSSDLHYSVLKSSEIRGRRYHKGTAHTLKPSPQHLHISSACRQQPFALISARVGVRRRNQFWHICDSCLG